MAQFQKHFVQDLQQDLKIRQCGTIVFNADDLSNVVSVELYDGENPYTPSGTVVGAVICPDGATVPIDNGTIDGNTVSITLTAACFAITGQIGVGIQLVTGSVKTTVLKAIYNAERFETDEVIDPDERIATSIAELEADIAAAVATIPADYSDLLAAVAPTFSADTTYGAGSYVWYTGKLYQFTQAHAAGAWTGTDAEEASIAPAIATGDYRKAPVITDTASGAVASFPDGADGYPPKSVKAHFSPVQAGSGDPAPDNIREISGWTGLTAYRTGVNIWDGTYTAGKSITASTGILTSAANTVCATGYIPVKGAVSYYFNTNGINSSSLGLAWYDAAKAYISGIVFNTLNKIGEKTAPANAAFVRFTLMVANVGAASVNYPASDTDYHAYSGQAYPVAFPATKNLLNESTLYHGYFAPASPSTMTENEAYRTAIVELPAGTYTFSTNLPNAYMLRMAIGDVNDGSIASTPPLTFTLTETNTVKICFRKSDSSTITETFNTQIEAGSTATSYEPYGTVYGGYIDLATGTLVAEFAATNFGSLSWNYYNDVGANAFFQANINDKAYGGQTDGYSSAFKLVVHSSSRNGFTRAEFADEAANNTLGYLYSNYSIVVRADAYTTSTAFKEAYKDAVLVYRLASPVTYQLTPAEIKTLLGANNIWNDANGSTDAEYCADTKLYIDRKIAALAASILNA